MATYNELVTRIEVATVKLEQDVTELSVYTDDIQTNTNSVIAVEVGKAQTAATQSQASAVAAKADADAIKAINPVSDAPKTGSTYGRNNGAWVLVESGGGGVGTVVSVNGVGPDAAGDVELAIPTKTSDLVNDSDYATVADVPTATSELTNDSGFLTSVPVGEAPVDGKQYARKDAAWAEVVSGGGGGGYELPSPVGGWTWTWSLPATKLNYGGFTGPTWQEPGADLVDSWTQDGKTPITTNPYQAMDIRSLKCVDGSGVVVFGTTATFYPGYNPSTGAVDSYEVVTTGWNAIFDNTSGNPVNMKKRMLPGTWYIDSFPTLPAGSHGLTNAAGKKAILTVIAMPGGTTGTFNRKMTLSTFGNSPTANSQLYVYDDGQKIWKPTIV